MTKNDDQNHLSQNPANSSPGPFINANVYFSLFHKEFAFRDHLVSLYGVTGLPWHHPNAREKIGEALSVRLELPHARDLVLLAEAQIIFEQTEADQTLGLKFYFEESAEHQLRDYIRQHGFHPEDHTRLHQRFTTQSLAEPISMRVKASFSGGKGSIHTSMKVCDVSNISTGGISIRSDNQMSFLIQPNDRIELAIEVTTDQEPSVLPARGVVRWTRDECLGKTGDKIYRFLGIQFDDLTFAQRQQLAAYLEQISGAQSPESPH